MPRAQTEADEKLLEAEGIVCANEGVMEEYRERTRKAAALAERRQEETTELETQRAALNEKKVRPLTIPQFLNVGCNVGFIGKEIK